MLVDGSQLLDMCVVVNQMHETSIHDDTYDVFGHAPLVIPEADTDGHDSSCLLVPGRGYI
jgi:hypothetical protein